MKRRRKRKPKWGNIFLALVILGAGVFFVYRLTIGKESEPSKPPVYLSSSGLHTPANTVIPNVPVKIPKDIAVIEERDGVSYLKLFGYEMILVNKEYSLPSDFGGENAEATAAVNALYAAAEADGLPMYTVSGYRSYATQESVYAGHVERKGQEAADLVSARPGHSEHQTGLAFDVNGSDSSTVLATRFGETAEFRWLNEHMADYGFILRYPEGKTDWTGYNYEPWHIRYVGVELAQKIHESGLTVEELIKENSISFFEE